MDDLLSSLTARREGPPSRADSSVPARVIPGPETTSRTKIPNKKITPQHIVLCQRKSAAKPQSLVEKPFLAWGKKCHQPVNCMGNREGEKRPGDRPPICGRGKGWRITIKKGKRNASALPESFQIHPNLGFLLKRPYQAFVLLLPLLFQQYLFHIFPHIAKRSG